jgi:hypothetical protein
MKNKQQNTDTTAKKQNTHHCRRCRLSTAIFGDFIEQSIATVVMQNPLLLRLPSKPNSRKILRLKAHGGSAPHPFAIALFSVAGVLPPHLQCNQKTAMAVDGRITGLNSICKSTVNRIIIESTNTLFVFDFRCHLMNNHGG